MTFEEIVSRLVELRQAEQECRWEMGDLLLAARQVFVGRGFARAIAGQLGCSTRHVEQLMRVAQTFSPEARALDMPWTLHQIAAQTKEPEFWLQQAVDNQWSTRQLRDAIRAAQERGPDRHDAAREADVLIRRVEEYAERWGRDGEAGLRELWLRITDTLERWRKESPAD